MLLALLLTTGLAAAPPLEGFPSTVTPVGDVLPANGRIVAFGDRVLRPDEVGVVAVVDGAFVTPATRIMGCCALELTFGDGAFDAGSDVAVTISHGGVDTDFAWVVGIADDAPPTLASAAVSQIVTTTSFSSPLPPQTIAEGALGLIVTVDLEGVGDDVGVSSLQAFDEAGTLIGFSPPAGVPADRIVVGVANEGEQCLRLVVVDGAGAQTELPLCDDVAVPLIDEVVPVDDDDDDDGCAAGPPMPVLLVLLSLLFVKRSARVLTTALLIVGFGSACARAPQGSAVCGDDFDDYSVPVDLITEDVFQAYAREQFGFVALKVLILRPDSDTPVVAILDSDFFPLHDAWFSWRLVNGQRACGAEQIAPLDPPLDVEQWSDVVDWAREQQRLPPFLDLVDDGGERLTAPDFYRLARNEEPRIYVPAYVRRDDDANTWQWRVGGRTTLEPRHVEAIFSALDPHIPSTHELVWVTSESETQTTTAATMRSTAHPLASRIRSP